MKGLSSTFTAVATLLALGCSGSQPRAQAAAEPVAEAPAAEVAEQQHETEDEGAKTADAPVEAESEEREVAAPEPEDVIATLADTCHSWCEGLGGRCSKAQVESCRLSFCAQYVPQEPACATVVRAAFDCAEAHRDVLLCSNVVSESCGRKFTAIDECVAAGGARAAEAEPGVEVPEGWAPFRASDPGFTALMPAGVEATTEEGVRRWVARAGAATYEIALQPAPPEKKLNQQAFLRMASRLLGPCAGRMKLFSLIERDTHTLMHFQSRCPDGSQERGALYVEGSQLYTIRARWTEGENVHADTFAYSFERER